MNEIDRELTKRNLNTRIVFIVYTDTTWPPITERIENPDRFSILLAPITRSYAYTTKKDYAPAVKPYERNKLVYPESLDEYFAYFAEWQKFWHGAAFSYEYHFWHHQYKDLAGVRFSERINEDVREYKRRGVNGIVEDGSQRSFFPTGLTFYTYARTLYDVSLTAEEIRDDYLEAAFGEAKEDFKTLLTAVSDAFEFDYVSGEVSEDTEISPYYAPSYAARLEETVPALLESGRAAVEKNYNSDYRTRTVSVRLIEHYLTFCDYYARAIIAKARGNDGESSAIFAEWRDRYGAIEYELRRYFDNFLFFRKLESVFVRDKSHAKNATEI